ncbi:MAG: hypothetical protein KatS3mg102_1087 [Planctomycetota bacterium]|nr:MAG: hypothetical protein KatS3mg102_1087 [Planctomycetota bacterium]
MPGPDARRPAEPRRRPRSAARRRPAGPSPPAEPDVQAEGIAGGGTRRPAAAAAAPTIERPGAAAALSLHAAHGGARSGRAAREAAQVERLLELVDAELGCGKDAALLKALHLYLRLARLARARATDPATLVAQALGAEERLAERERELEQTRRKLRRARQLARVRARLPLERLFGASGAARGQGAEGEGSEWRRERRALELELDRLRHEMAEMRLEAIRRLGEQGSPGALWAAAPWMPLALAAGAAGGAPPPPAPTPAGLQGSGPRCGPSPVEIFRRWRAAAAARAQRPPAAGPSGAAAGQPQAGAPGAEPPPPRAAPAEPAAAVPGAAERIAELAAAASAAPRGGADEPAAVQPLASSRLPRPPARCPGAELEQPAPLPPARQPPEPSPEGRAAYTEHRVKLPKITF